jgi:hypothetical protein
MRAIYGYPERFATVDLLSTERIKNSRIGLFYWTTPTARRARRMSASRARF